MKKLLIILLLIVGCAPKTTTTFYIGMTQDEFQIQNPDIKRMDLTVLSGKKEGLVIGKQAVDKSIKTNSPYFYIEEKEGIVSYLSFGLFSSFTYHFDTEVDTLTSVNYGFWEVNYDKYTTSPKWKNY